MAISTACGGEATQAGLQLGHDVDERTVTVAADGSNAFCLLDMVKAAEAAEEEMAEAEEAKDGEYLEALKLLLGASALCSSAW